MNFRDTPSSDVVGHDFRNEHIAAFLEQIIDGGLFTYQEEIEGLGISGRILFIEEQPGAVPCHRPLSARDAAEELHTLRKVARYSPSHNPDGIKGWQVRKATVHGKPVAIILAQWICL